MLFHGLMTADLEDNPQKRLLQDINQGNKRRHAQVSSTYTTAASMASAIR